jgi:CheY-like chemotaxis protein
LIGNAVKFTSEGGVTVRVERGAVVKNHVPISIFVKDTGAGIDDEQRSRLFQPFVQADNSTSRKFGGTGLGLALSRRLARALGGDVRIESSSEKGSEFVVHFDAEIADQQAEPAKMEKATTAGEAKVKRLENMNILVVDDSPDNRTLMSLLLRREGAVVAEAADGEEAVNKALNGDFAIVLMDIQMPEMDGYTALATLRKQDYTRPIVALTAHAMVEERRRTAAAGFNDHVTKPVDQNALVKAILDLVRE